MAILFGHRNIYPILSLSLVVAIELIAACQALDFHRPKRTTDPLEEVYKLVRSVVKTLDTDRFMAPDIAAVTNLIQEGKVRERRGGGRGRKREDYIMYPYIGMGCCFSLYGSIRRSTSFWTHFHCKHVMLITLLEILRQEHKNTIINVNPLIPP